MKLPKFKPSTKPLKDTDLPNPGSREESRSPSARELRAAQAAEISRMATELAPAFESFAKSADAWERLFPADPQSPVDTDPNFLYGDWQFDETKTVEVLKRLGQQDDIEWKLENLLSLGRPLFRISPTTIE